MVATALVNAYRRNSRRLSEIEGVFQRRRFRALRREFYDQLWRGAAGRLGAEYVEHDGGFAEIRLGGLATFVQQSDVMLDSALIIAAMADKALTYDLLARKGYPLPAHQLFTLSQLPAAEAFLRAQRGAVVVKPANGTGGGRGVTTGVTTAKSLRRAARIAAGFNPNLLVEEHLSGKSYRLLYLDGVYVDAVRRDAPAVVGDGRRTIRELVVQENLRRRRSRPLSALSPLVIDGDSRNCLERQGLSPAHRPRDGEAVIVKAAINENCASQNLNVRDEISKDIVQAGAALVSDLGVRCAGVDLICDDASLPLEQGRGIFTEVNVNPGIHHHYLIADPDRGVAVADRLLEHLFSQKAGVMKL